MSNNIYNTWYSRTYYVLKNKTSGKKYIGQTISNPGVNYFGSGKYWINHCKTYGGYCKTNIELVWSEYFEDKDSAVAMLKKFKKDNPDYYSVENTEWANLIEENTENNPIIGAGEYQKNRILNGTHPFNNKETYKKRWTDEHKKRQSEDMKGNLRNYWQNLSERKRNQIIEKIRQGNIGKKSKYKGVPRTEEQKLSISEGTKKAMNDQELRGHLSKKAKLRCESKKFKDRTRETNRRRVSCIHCRYETGLSSLGKHQKGQYCKR